MDEETQSKTPQSDSIGHQNEAQAKRIRFVLVLNLCFVAVELVGSYLTNSTAIFADALHDLGDVAGLGIALYANRKARTSANNDYTMGYSRWSTVGSVAIGLVLLGGCAAALFHAVPQLLSPTQPHAPGMMALAGLGVVVNLVGAAVLSRGSQSMDSLLSWHLIEDVLGWTAVLIGGAAIHFTGWGIIDPLFAIVIAFVVARGASRHLAVPLRILLQRSPPGFNLEDFRSNCLQIRGVQSLHDVFFWSLSEHQHVMSVHVVCEDSIDHEQIRRIKSEVREQVSVPDTHVTLEIEFSDEGGQELQVDRLLDPASHTCSGHHH